MAERNISVRLTARVDAYVAAMKRAEAETAGFSRKSQRNLARVGTQMQTVGRRMTTAVTLPLVGIGAAAVKMAMDFDSSLARIQALVGVSADDVGRLRDAALSLSGETAQGPRALADAMFFATSAGLSASDAIEAVEASAKASAVGLGDVRTVTDLVTSAMNAYGSDTLSAAEATDVLTNAVRLGKLEPGELAGAMGRVLPIASALGVEFHEVAAAFASMSRTGTNAQEAGTQLRGILSTLLSPSAEARTAIESVGLTVEGLQRSLREDGLLATLDLLVGSFDGNVLAMEAVFGNIRALSGVMDMLGGNVDATREVFDGMADSTGVLDEAFGIVADTAEHRMRQAMANIEAALIGVGEILLPIVADVADRVAGMARTFADLPQPVQRAAVAFGGLLAAIGPLLLIGGSLLRNWVAINTQMALMGAAAPRTARLMRAGGLIAGLALVGVLLKDIIADLPVLGSGLKLLTGERAGIADAFDRTSESLLALTDAALQNATAMDRGFTAAEAAEIATRNLGAATLAAAADNEEFAAALRTFSISGDEFLSIIDGMGTGLRGNATAIELVQRALGLTDAAAETFLNTWLDGETDMARMAAAFGVTEDQVRDVVSGLGMLQDQAVENWDVTRDLALAFLDTAAAAGGLAAAAVDQAWALNGGTRDARNAEAAYSDFVRIMSELEVVTARVVPLLTDLGIEQGRAEKIAVGLVGSFGDQVVALWDLGQALDVAEEHLAPLVVAMARVSDGVAPDLESALMDTAASIGLVGEEAEAFVAGVMAAGAELIAVQAAADGVELDELADDMDAAAAAADGMGDEMSEAADHISELDDRIGSINSGLDRLAEALDVVIGSTIALQRADDNWLDTLEDVVAGIEDAVKEGVTWNDVLTGSTRAARDVREGIRRAGDEVLGYAETAIKAGMSQDEATAAALSMRDALVNEVAAAFGITRSEAEQYLTQLGLTPESVVTAVELANQAAALDEINELQRELGNIPERVQTRVQALIDAGQFRRARGELLWFQRTITATVNIAMPNLAGARRNLAAFGVNTTAHAVAEGGFFHRPTFPTLIGEAGAEVVLPLTRPDRMRDLLADPRAAPIWAAMGGAGRGGGGSSLSVDTINVGSRDDAAAMMNKLDELRWRSGVAA